MAPNLPKIITLELTDISYGGDAIGRHDGMVVFVPFGIPGETVQVALSENKNRFARGQIIKVMNASPLRVDAPCQYFERCGGCHWQHIRYDAQLEFKQKIVRDTIQRIGGFDQPIVHPTTANNNQWNYRSHETFHLDKQGRLGFVSTDNNSVIAIKDCLIARPEILQELNSAQARAGGGRIRVQVGSEGQVTAFRVLSNDEGQGEKTEGKPTHYTVLEHNFQCSPGSFFQADPIQAGKLVELILSQLELKGSEKVLDLFSGVGLFTTFLAEQASEVISVEFSSIAVQDAQFNLRAFDNVTLLEGGIREALLSDVMPPSLPIDYIVVDPPRSGIRREDLEAVMRKSPQKLVYVSCDPATLSRDAKILVENGYALVDVQPVDMFPQTYHIEVVASFKRK